MQNIPTIQELQLQIANDFKNKLNLSDANLKYVLDAMDSVLAAQFKLMYLYLSDIQNNVFPDTADIEANGGTLERFGRIYLNRNPRPSTSGIFKALVVGTAGSVLRASLTFKSNEDALNAGKLFVLDEEVILTTSPQEIEIRSLGGGLEFNLNIGDNLTITEPVLGVENNIVISSVVEQPRSSEDIEVYRQNILDAIQLEPQGGSKTDYRLWASDAQGVRKVYPYVKNEDAGQVIVYVEATISDSIDGEGTPDTTLLQNVLDVILLDPDETKPIDERGRKPIQAIIPIENILPIDLVPVDFTINGLVNSSISVQESILTNLKQFLYDVRPYSTGADLPRSKNDILYQARLQSVVTDVLDSDNFFNNLVMEVNGVEVLTYEFNLGFIPYLRNLNIA